MLRGLLIRLEIRINSLTTLQYSLIVAKLAAILSILGGDGMGIRGDLRSGFSRF